MNLHKLFYFSPKNWRILVVLPIFLAVCNGYKVLFLGPFNGKSHALYLQSFVRALLDRGHEVTYLTSQSLNHLNLANYSEVLIDPPFDLHSLISQERFVNMGSKSPFQVLTESLGFLGVINNYAFQSANVQKFIHSNDLQFDVVINEDFFGESFLMFAHKFKAPIVTICPYGIPHSVDEQMGLLTPLSIAPHWMLPYSDNMTFYERFYNAMLSTYNWILRRYYFIPSEEVVVKNHFKHLEPLPSLDELIRSVSVVLVNSHRATSPPRPTMPGIISVGGAHIKANKELPVDLQRFLDESKHGVIYFSLGSVIKSSMLPKEITLAFLGAFKSLKQRVLWKFEDDSLGDIPSNVMIQKWMPQNDILAHTNVILFISHGGIFGTTESLYHGVPMLLIPFFGDQLRNAHRISTAGYGKYITIDKITKDTLLKTLNEITSDQTFLNNAKHTSSIFKDNVVNPMDEAIFWIEHVAKFKGAKHLKSHAVNMSWFTYLSLDVILSIIFVGLCILFVLRTLIKKLFSKKNFPTDWDKKEK